MREAEAERRQAVLLDAGHLAKGARQSRRAGTSGRSRSRRCRAAARPAMPSTRASTSSRWSSGQATQSAETKCALRLSGAVAPRSCNSRSIRAMASLKSLFGPAQRARIDAGCAVERIDHEAGIVGERRQLCRLRRGDRLDPRVGLEGLAGFFGLAKPEFAGGDRFDAVGREQFAHLASLPGLWVAMTSLPAIRRCMCSGDRQLLQIDQTRRRPSAPAPSAPGIRPA